MVYYNRKTKITENIKDSKALIFLYKTIPGRIILKVLTRKSVSKLFGLITNTKISTIYIKKFIDKNNIDIKKFEEKKYNSFNDFFTRKLKTSKIKELNKKMLISPCDSKLLVKEISNELTITVKNSIYNIENLIKEEISKEYEKGYCLIFRLSPEDYHRYHAFDDSKVISTKKINGILHTVNPVSYNNYHVFTENNREVTLLKTSNFKEVYQIEVGALNVGKIHNHDKKHLKDMKKKATFHSEDRQ